MSDTPSAEELFHENREPNGIKLDRRVGLGRRSVWYRANQVRLGRLSAVKYLRPALAASQSITESFFEAGRQAAVIIHPSAIPIFNVYRKECCIATHWCTGKSLKELRYSLPVATIANIGWSVMDCLSAIHATGRVHGNLAPGNVFLDEDGKIWINDFFQPPYIVDGDVRYIGDERFMAPEVADGGHGEWNSDAFSLARILTYVLDPDSSSETLSQLLSSMQAPGPSLRGSSPQAIAEGFARVKREEKDRLGIGIEPKRGQRLYRRVPAEFEVSLRRRSATPIETATLLMKIRDIGESGVFVETSDETVDIGTILELDFALKGVAGNVHALGIVRWRSRPPMPSGVGVQFVEVDQAGIARLREYLRNT